MSLAVTLGLLLPAGFGAALLIPHAIPRAAPGRAGALFLLGGGVTGSLLFLLGTAGVPLGTPAFAAIPLGAVALITARRRDALRFVRGTRFRFRPHEWATTLLILGPTAVLLWTGSVLPLSDFDGRTTWVPKAQAIAREEAIRGPFFQGTRGLHLHSHYPLLAPLNAAAAMRLSGDGEGFRPLYALVPAALLLAVRDLAVRRAGPALLIAAAAWLPQLTGGLEGSASTAYADLWLAAFFGMAVTSLVARGRRGLGAAGLWCAFAVLTKNEGLVLALAACGAAALLRPGVRAMLRVVLLPAAAATLLAVWRASIPEAYDERNAILVRELPLRLGSLDDAARAIARHAAVVRVWGLLWPAAVAAALVRARRRRVAVAAVAGGLALAAYVVVLACTSWNIDELARVAADRLLAHVLIPALLVLSVRLRS